MVVWCKYCNLPVASYSYLQCQKCDDFVHFNCVQQEKPDRLEGDVLFDFICKFCGGVDGEEVSRIKMTWLQAIHLALYNLSIRESGRQGFFRWKDDICPFLSQHWNTLFPDKPMTSNWRSTVAGTLSVYCTRLFKSGQAAFSETGWWALVEVKPPPKSYGCGIKIKQSVPKSRDWKRKFDDSDVLSQNICQVKSSVRVEESIIDKNFIEINRIEDVASVYDKESLDSVQINDMLNGDFYLDHDSIENVVPNDDPFSLLKMEDLGKEIPKGLLDSCDETSVFRNMQSGAKECEQNMIERNCEESPVYNQELVKEKVPPNHAKLAPMNVLQEREFLKKLTGCTNAVSEDPLSKRLIRKIRLRKLKTEMCLPLFDLDETVRRMIRMSKPHKVEVVFTDWIGREVRKPMEEEELQTYPAKSNVLHHPALHGINILDRFRTMPCQLSQNIHINRNSCTFLSRLVGSKNAVKLSSIVSPYTQRVLKHFIRRDFETKPLKVKLMEELIAYSHRFDQHWITPCPSPIDYCYVQPHHIPIVNAMCEDFFWNGINLSECLQYPDFSCVALYKKLLIGFAFMVPDVKYNEAYISFILVHPDWRRAGIGTFMIYHLIQTCMGKDVTLHVSASNPSIMLYHKFGFKAEEFILDFYDKYLPEESCDSKHALFLRLQR